MFERSGPSLSECGCLSCLPTEAVNNVLGLGHEGLTWISE